jgi:cellulose synthase/poly-beta-1,6-N-acetylglucosamine synthase-like glycosyltransferase
VTAFSVVVPLFQKRPFVARAIESVLAQTHPATDVVVVDDGSTDGGGAEVRRRFPAVIVIRQENAGVGAARNTGIEASSSPWIAFLDADDYWTPHHLEELARMATLYPKAVLLSTRWQRVEHRSSGTIKTTGRSAIARVDYFREAAHRSPVWTSSAAIAHQAYDRIGGFGSARLGEDQEYWARLALAGPVVVSSAVTAAYVRGVDSVTEAVRRERQPEVVPQTAAEALPVFAALQAAMASDHPGVPTESLHVYWNAKLARKVREAISRSEFARARALAGFLQLPLTAQEQRIALVARLPRWTLRAAVALKYHLRHRPEFEA